jgi:hypothetical protein
MVAKPTEILASATDAKGLTMAPTATSASFHLMLALTVACTTTARANVLDAPSLGLA